MNGGKGIAIWFYGVMALAVAMAAGVDAADGTTEEDVSLHAQRSSAGCAEGAASRPGAGAEADADARAQRSAEGYMRDRDPNTLRDIMTLRETRSVKRDAGSAEKQACESATKGADETNAPGASAGTNAAKATTGTKAIAGATGLRSVQYGDHWVYDAGTDLLLDADRDGYYRYLRVHFDVDSYFDSAYVYARLYTSPDGESWDFYYETDDFLVTGSTPDDAYEVESELLANYPPDLYDVLVEVYDADTDMLVDEFGPVESSAFSLLPLEDADFDGATPAPVVVVSDEHGGGGSFSWAALLALAAVGALRLVLQKNARLRAGRFRGTVR
jgi:hypothetical protein